MSPDRHHAGAVCPRCRPSPTQGGTLGVAEKDGARRCPTCGHRWFPLAPVLQPAPMAAPKNPRGGRKPRAGVTAAEKVTLRLTADEHDAFSKAALTAGFRMPVTKAEPEPRGAVGAWLRSLGLKALEGSKT